MKTYTVRYHNGFVVVDDLTARIVCTCNGKEDALAIIAALMFFEKAIVVYCPKCEAKNYIVPEDKCDACGYVDPHELDG